MPRSIAALSGLNEKIFLNYLRCMALPLICLQMIGNDVEAEAVYDSSPTASGG